MNNPDWNKGFAAGAKSQRIQDISSFIKLMNELEKVKGIGTVTKERIITALYQRME